MLKNYVPILFALAIFTGSLGSTSATEERFHPVESVCIEYVLKGQLMNGTILRCHRKYGFETFEVQNTVVGIGNLTQKQNSHNITIGDKIYAINLETGKGTITTNPMYQHFKASITERGESPEGIGRGFLNAMGYVPDGTSKTIDNTVCKGYQSPSIGYACLTEELLMLEQAFLGNNQTAVRVNIGDDGGDENYTLWQRAEMREGPDLSNGINIQDLIKHGGGQAGGNSQGGATPQIPAELQDLLKQIQPK